MLAEWWAQWCEMFAGSPVLLVFATAMVAMMVPYYVFGGLHLYLDITHSPAFLYKYKLQPNAPFDTKDLPKLMWQVKKSAFLATIPTVLGAAYVSSLELSWLGLSVSPELPANWFVGDFLVKLVGCVLVEEVMFFYSHWLLHQPMFFGRVHKIHHEFKAPIAFAATYAHPFEMFLGNVLPLLVGPLVFRMHLASLALWLFLSVLSTEMHHSGYNFPWYLNHGQPKFHDDHHKYFVGNYGLLGLLDWVHSTTINDREMERKKKKEQQQLKEDEHGQASKDEQVGEGTEPASAAETAKDK